MKRGLGILTAGRMGVHPSTVSRNKDREDVAAAATAVTHERAASQLLTTLNKSDDLRGTDSGRNGDAGGQ
jgi:hypothetical protein